MADRSVARTLGNLLLAVLNATLILIALCLWLAWSALSTAERISTNIAAASEAVLPLRGELRTLTSEISETRAELAQLAAAPGALSAEVEALEARLDRLEAQLGQVAGALADLSADPEAAVDAAIEATFEELGAMILRILGELRGPASPA